MLSQRHPCVHKLLDYEDEVLALILALVDWHSLSSSQATFAEALYGLRRGPAASAASPTTTPAAAAPHGQALGSEAPQPGTFLSPSQRHASLAAQARCEGLLHHGALAGLHMHQTC